MHMERLMQQQSTFEYLESQLKKELSVPPLEMLSVLIVEFKAFN